MADETKLRELALAATPGPWIACGPSHGGPLPKFLNEVIVDTDASEDVGETVACCLQGTAGSPETDADMAFIAAANPATVLALLDELAALRELVDTHELLKAGYRERAEAAERLADNRKVALDEWFAKTEWVQATAQPKELGMHRADVLRQRLAAAERLAADWRKLGDTIFHGMDDGNGCAPCHDHEVPGIWDRDNGSRAGKPCQDCIDWRALGRATHGHEPWYDGWPEGGENRPNIEPEKTGGSN